MCVCIYVREFVCVCQRARIDNAQSKILPIREHFTRSSPCATQHHMPHSWHVGIHVFEYLLIEEKRLHTADSLRHSRDILLHCQHHVHLEGVLVQDTKNTRHTSANVNKTQPIRITDRHKPSLTVWFSSRLYYPFGKGPGEHIIRCLKNKKCKNERTCVRTNEPGTQYKVRAGWPKRLSLVQATP